MHKEEGETTECFSSEYVDEKKMNFFALMSLARTNASTHSRLSENGGSTRSVKIEMITAVLASKYSLRSTPLKLSDTMMKYDYQRVPKCW